MRGELILALVRTVEPYGWRCVVAYKDGKKVVDAGWTEAAPKLLAEDHLIDAAYVLRNPETATLPLTVPVDVDKLNGVTFFGLERKGNLRCATIYRCMNGKLWVIQDGEELSLQHAFDELKVFTTKHLFDNQNYQPELIK